MGSPNTPFRTSTADRKKLQFLRSENIHKKEKHAATYDVVRARPSCIWKARWSVVSLRENQSFSKWMLKHRLICTYLLQQHMTRLCRYREVVSEMLQKNQKMAYVQKLYNSVYMHMHAYALLFRRSPVCYLENVGECVKKIYLRKIFRFFFGRAFFWLFFTFVWLFLIKDWLFIDFLRIYTIWTYAIFWIFWNDFMNKQSTKSQEKVNQKSTKSQFFN